MVVRTCGHSLLTALVVLGKLKGSHRQKVIKGKDILMIEKEKGKKQTNREKKKSKRTREIQWDLREQ